MHVAKTHLDKSLVPESLRVSHFVFNDISPEPSRELLALRQARSRELASHLGVPLIQVASNLSDFHNLTFQATHTIQNATVPLLLRRGTGRWLYASGFPLTEVRTEPTHDLASIDPLLLPMLSTSALSLISIGGSKTRVEKTRAIADWPVAHDFLTVCVRSVPNCGRCSKCLRTLLTLELLGDLDRFANSFDLAAYQERRDDYIAEVLVSDEFMLQEIVDLARAQSFTFSRAERLRGFSHRVVRRSLIRPLLSTRWAHRVLLTFRRSPVVDRSVRAIARRYG